MVHTAIGQLQKTLRQELVLHVTFRAMGYRFLAYPSRVFTV
jgi:hypothetical protein